MRALQAAARHGLAEAVGPHHVADHEVGSLVRQAVEHRLVGLLDQAIADGAVVVPDEVAEGVTARALEVAAWSLLVERRHLVVGEVLTAAGIEHRFLKGPTVAHRYYPHPGLRPFADVDVLVRSDALDDAVRSLRGAGVQRNHAELVAGFSARYGKSVTMTAPGGIEVDVHRLLASGPFGALRPPDPLWERPAAGVRLGGTVVPALDDASALLHACVHVVTGRSVRLGSLRDVVQIGARVDEHQVEPLARDLGVRACLVQAARLVQRDLGAEPPVALQAATQGPVAARERRWLDLYATPHRYGDLAWASLGATPGARAKVAYAWSLGRAWAARRRRSR